MKVNLIYSNGEIQPGWTNISPFGKDGCITASLDKLDDYICDGEVTELHALDVLEYYMYDKVAELLAYFAKKLQKNGSLILSFDDLYILVTQLTNGMPLKEFCVHIHGQQDKGNTFKRSSLSMQEIIYICLEVGLKVIKKRIDGSKVYLEFIKC